MKFNLFKLLVCLIFISVLSNVNSFNFSPKPNYIFNEPNLKTYAPKYESSFFGYSLNLRQKCLMVGSPRAQSDLPLQQENNEAGAVYKCNFDSKICAPFYFNKQGNNFNPYDNNTYNYEIKNNQWLGAVMDGNSSLVTCAPNIITKYQKSHYMFHGVCYRVSNTDNWQPKFVQKFADLRSKYKQSMEHNYIHMFGQQGFSLHVIDEIGELIMGAPGVFNWQGTVLRYKLNHVDIKMNSEIVKYELDVLDYGTLKIQFNSYFGYTVTSAFFFGKEVLYIASAPRSNDLKGEVFIFDFFKSYSQDPYRSQMLVYENFKGTQIGEYFGYAILADDFNGDNLIDVVISAPLYKKTESSFDNGKVYIFLNKGHMTFIEQNCLFSGSLTNGRFGTTLSKIGDINHDNYNDIAVSAPFEGNGVVYIFLGSERGLVTKPIQCIKAPNDHLNSFGMFGMAISNALDIDGNGFNDIAIGAPNAEMAYIYKSYPVVRIFSKIESLTPEININDTQFTIKYCWRYSTTKVQTNFDIKLEMKIELDHKFGRLKFAKSNTNEKTFIVSAARSYKCNEEIVLVKYSLADILNQLTLKLTYDLVKKIPNTEDFCENCVVINPKINRSYQKGVIISTGCKKKVCVADLKINSIMVDVKLPYILGSTKKISIKYVVENFGEIAYFAKINLTIPRTVTFNKIPPNCQQDLLNLLCDLGKALLYRGEQEHILISLDTTNLNGQTLNITAITSSLSEDENLTDNTLTDIIPLTEYSEIAVIGKSSLPSIDENIQNITHTFQIINSGPSNMKHIKFSFYLPLIFTNSETQIEFPLIEFNSIKTQGFYNKKELEIKWTPVENHEELNENIPISNNYDQNYANIPTNRTLYYNCEKNVKHYCVKGSVDVYNFLTENIPIYVQFTFTIDLNKIADLYLENQDIFVISTFSKVTNEEYKQNDTIKLVKLNPYTVMTRIIKIETPLWIYILSSIGGLIILILITLVLYKIGFFRRRKFIKIKNEQTLELKNNNNQYRTNTETNIEPECEEYFLPNLNSNLKPFEF